MARVRAPALMAQGKRTQVQVYSNPTDNMRRSHTTGAWNNNNDDDGDEVAPVLDDLDDIFDGAESPPSLDNKKENYANGLRGSIEPDAKSKPMKKLRFSLGPPGDPPSLLGGDHHDGDDDAEDEEEDRLDVHDVPVSKTMKNVLATGYPRGSISPSEVSSVSTAPPSTDRSMVVTATADEEDEGDLGGGADEQQQEKKEIDDVENARLDTSALTAHDEDGDEIITLGHKHLSESIGGRIDGLETTGTKDDDKGEEVDDDYLIPPPPPDSPHDHDEEDAADAIDLPDDTANVTTRRSVEFPKRLDDDDDDDDNQDDDGFQMADTNQLEDDDALEDDQPDTKSPDVAEAELVTTPDEINETPDEVDKRREARKKSLEKRSKDKRKELATKRRSPESVDDDASDEDREALQKSLEKKSKNKRKKKDSSKKHKLNESVDEVETAVTRAPKRPLPKRGRLAVFSPKGIQTGPLVFKPVPVSDSHDSTAPEGVRRSRRTRVPPLAFWKNERAEYGPNRFEGVLAEVVGDMPVIRSYQIAEPTPYKKRKTNVVSSTASKGKKKKTKSTSNQSVAATVDRVQEINPSRLKYKISDGDKAHLWDDTFEESTEMKVISYLDRSEVRDLPISSSRKKSEGMVGGRAAQAFNVMNDESAVYPGYIMGDLTLPPRGIKDAESVGSCAQTFTVVTGQPKALEVGFGHPDHGNGVFVPETAVRFLLNPGDKFRIPPGNCYRLQNHSKHTEVLLTWTIIRPHRFDET